MGIWVFLAVLNPIPPSLTILDTWSHWMLQRRARRKENLRREYSKITLFWVDSYSDNLSAGTICIIATELEESLAIGLIEADP